MASLESINDKLRIAAENLDQAAIEIRDLPLEPTKQHIRAIGEALANIIEIQHKIYRMRPELEPDYLKEEKPEPDGELTPDQEILVAQLTNEEIKEIDNALLANTCDKWRKVARVVGTTMLDFPCRLEGVPDVFYSQRIKKLVNDGLLESQGNLDYMRFSEVRRPDGNET
jgi:hypothetical protein